MSTLLAIDTATEVMHLALVAGDAVHVRAEAGGARASLALLPALHALLAQAGVTLAQVEAFAFGRGPGAFTGLRTACAVTQGLALGTGRPVISLDTLMAVAESARLRGAVARGQVLWAATDARMGEVYAARYLLGPDSGPGLGPAGWQTLDAPALYAPQTLAARLAAEPAVVAGNAAEVYVELLRPVAQALWPQAVPEGAALAALARAAWLRGERLDAAQAVPLYVRDKVAQTTAEREQARARAAAAPQAAGGAA
jgi:tRNA threonylcarbamoyladenosine biosynthesis protein TsaB